MLEEVLGRERDIRLIGCVADAETALEMVGTHRPDVTTIDVAMPGMDGLALLDQIRHRTRAVMLSSRTDSSEEALSRGALAFFDKSKILAESAKLLKLVRAAADGKLKARSA